MTRTRISHSMGAALALAVFALALVNGVAGDTKKTAKESGIESLPDGALKRLGSLRWRHAEPITFLAFPPDGKTLITAAQDSILRLWDRETGKELRRFVPPADPNAKGVVQVSHYMQRLTRAAMSKDGKLLAVVLPGNKVQLWEVETGKALRQVKAPADGTAAMAFTPDGKTLVIRSITDRIAFLHDAETGKEIRQLKAKPPMPNGGPVFGGAGDGTGIAISHDGKVIALAELEYVNQRVFGSVTLFEIGTGNEIRRFDMPQNGIGSLAFSPDGKTLVLNTHGAVYVYNAETGKEIRQLKAGSGVHWLLLAPDGQTVAVKGHDQLVRLFDANTGNLVHTLGEVPGQRANFGFVNLNGAVLNDGVFSADSKTLVLGGQQVPRFFDVAAGREIPHAGDGHRGAVAALMVSADGKSIVSRGAEGLLRVWSATTGQHIRALPETHGTSAVLFSPDGKLVALANNNGMVRLLDVADGKEKRQFKAHQGSIATLAFSADGQRLATRGGYDGSVRIFDVARGTELKRITVQDFTDVAAGAVLIRVANANATGHPLVFSPDGMTLAVYVTSQEVLVQGRAQPLPESNSLRLFDVATGKEVRRTPMPSGLTIKQLVYSVDGRLLISENFDKTASLWEIASGQERNRLGKPVTLPPQPDATTWVNAKFRTGPATVPVGVTIARSRDGRLIASPGAKNTIQVFDLSLGKEVAAFPGHGDAIASLVFAADGKTLVTGGADTTLLIWDLTRLKREPGPQFAELSAKELAGLWTDLGNTDARSAGRTVQTLIAASNASVALLKDAIQPATPADAKQVEQWLRDLDSNSFQKRAIALSQLKKLGELAIPALQKVLADHPPIETRRRVQPLLEELTGRKFTVEQIRIIRAVEVLERVGTTQARQVLERLAGGAPTALTTRQARAALDRLAENKK